MSESTSFNLLETTGGYACPIDPAEALLCDSCQ